MVERLPSKQGVVSSSLIFRSKIIMMKRGNKQNSFLNGEWEFKVNKAWKKVTAGLRRAQQKRYINAVTKREYDPTSIDCKYMLL